MQQSTTYKDTMRGTWATGDYDAMMRQEDLYEVGERLVRHLGIGAGERVLDVATGTGNVAIPAALAGAQVTGLDLTPELLTVARQRAADAGVHVDWVEGDAEALPFDEGDFDVVLSTFGAQFAPRHEVVADEIARVLRPGGRIGLIAWTAEGAIGDFFRTVAPHLPTPPEFVQPRLSPGVTRSTCANCSKAPASRRGSNARPGPATLATPPRSGATPAAFGPVAVARELAEADGDWTTLRDDMTAPFERLDTTPDPELVFPAEYPLVTGTKAR